MPLLAFNGIVIESIVSSCQQGREHGLEIAASFLVTGMHTNIPYSPFRERLFLSQEEQQPCLIPSGPGSYLLAQKQTGPLTFG